MKHTYKQSATKNEVTMYPEINYYETLGAFITLHLGDDKYYAITNVLVDDTWIKNIYVSETLDGINLCLKTFKAKFQDAK